MGIIKEEIKGTKILNEIESSNIVRTEYDTATKNDRFSAFKPSRIR